MFIEVKLNESYEESHNRRSYNSSIKGQLELKWRAVTLLAANKGNLNRGARCIVENHSISDFYQPNPNDQISAVQTLARIYVPANPAAFDSIKGLGESRGGAVG